MRLLFLSVLTVITLQLGISSCIAADEKLSHIYYDVLLFIDVDRSAVSCEGLPLTVLIKETTKIAQKNRARSWVVIETASYTNFLNYKDRMLGADTIIWDSNTEIARRLNIDNLPSILGINRTGEVLFLYQRDDVAVFLQGSESRKLRAVNFMELPGISLEQTADGALCKAYLPTINFQDSILTTLDLPRNSLSVYSTKDGKFLRRISPNEQIEQFYSRMIAPKLLQSMQKDKYPVRDFDCINPADRTGKCVLTKDMINDTNRKIGMEGISSASFSSGMTTNNSFSRRCVGYQGTALPAIFPSEVSGFSSSFLKYRPPYYYCNVTYTPAKEDNNTLSDSICLFYLCKDAPSQQGNYFLSIGALQSAYTLKNFDANTLGVLEYCAGRNEFVYLNPWNGIFCAVSLTGSIRKFTPAGLLLRAMLRDSSYRPISSKRNDSMLYFVDDVIVDSGYCYVLLQPSTPRRSTEYVVVQKYDWNGALVTETPLLLSSDSFTRAHIAGISRKELYVLAKTRGKGWQLRRFGLK
jgi:hypothetical protein